MLSRIAVAVGGLLFGIAMIALVELLLGAFGVGDDAPLYDPFAGFSSAVAMFEVVDPEAAEPIYRIASARVRTQSSLGAEPQREFRVHKADNEFRVFVVGGSSSMGVPYSTNYAFSGWLERRLRASLPGLDVKVVNASMSGYASRRIVPIAEEIVRYEPDLLVAYMGHNEWAERMYYSHLLNMDPRLFRLLEWAYRTRIYALASGLLDLTTSREPPELDLDFDDNAQQMFGVLRKRASGRDYPSARELEFRDILYEHNLRSIARTLKQHGAALAFVTLSQNFSDWPPPASLHRPGLADADLARWEEFVADGDALAKDAKCEDALGAYASALEIDDQFADLHFRVANCHRALGHNAEALAHYRLASDLDPVPQGAHTRFNDLIRRVAGEEGAILVDADRALIEESGDGLVGDDLFTDFAHPNLRAHQRIAAAIAEAMREAGVPVPAAEWKDGYRDPPPTELYAQEPRLEVLELQSRVFVCVLAARPACRKEAARLVAMDPGNKVGVRVLAQYAKRGKKRRE